MPTTDQPDHRRDEPGPARRARHGAPVASSVEELLAGATDRRPMKTADSLSGARFEQVVIDGRPHVVKYLHPDDDWLMRATGDLTGRPVEVWRAGLVSALPPTIDTAMVGCAAGSGRNGWGSALLLHDVGPHLVPEGVEPLDDDQHARFVEHMADLHAAFWDDPTVPDLMPAAHRLLELSPITTEVEAARAADDPVPPLIAPGWQRLRTEAPAAAAVARDLLDDPTPLLAAQAAGPQTLVHGDWKLGNLGSHPDGRTILLDWAVPGRAPGPVDLAWYLAVNCDRLPRSGGKEATIERYRRALEHRGIETAGWWEPQLGLALVTGFVQMAWSKTGPELGWWAERLLDAERHLG